MMQKQVHTHLHSAQNAQAVTNLSIDTVKATFANASIQANNGPHQTLSTANMAAVIRPVAPSSTALIRDDS